MSSIFGHNCDLLVMNLHHRLHSFIILIENASVLLCLRLPEISNASILL